MLRRIGAVIAGLLAISVLSVTTDALLHAAGVLPGGQPPRTALLLVAIAFRIVYAVVGSYVAARLALDRPMAHALALGVVSVVLGTVSNVAGRGHAPGPAWYSVALIAIAIPCAWVGGKLRTMQMHGRGG